MQRQFYKGLDRPVNVFGLRGGWIKYFGIAAGGALVLAFIVGFIAGSGAGMGTFIGGVVVGFFVCLLLQSKRPARRLNNMGLASKMEMTVVRRETLARIVLKDPRKDNSEKYQVILNVPEHVREATEGVLALYGD